MLTLCCVLFQGAPSPRANAVEYSISPMMYELSLLMLKRRSVSFCTTLSSAFDYFLHSTISNVGGRGGEGEEGSGVSWGTRESYGQQNQSKITELSTFSPTGETIYL
jgi:hypothetical protein